MPTVWVCETFRERYPLPCRWPTHAPHALVWKRKPPLPPSLKVAEILQCDQPLTGGAKSLVPCGLLAAIALPLLQRRHASTGSPPVRNRSPTMEEPGRSFALPETGELKPRTPVTMSVTDSVTASVTDRATSIATSTRQEKRQDCTLHNLCDAQVFKSGDWRRVGCANGRSNRTATGGQQRLRWYAARSTG
jgi:hypothetical protein